MLCSHRSGLSQELFWILTPEYCQRHAGKGGYEQQQQAHAWQTYIAWEKSNAQGLPVQHLAARVSLAYECALTVLQHFPEV